MASTRDFLGELGRRAPQLALAILAARQGGMPALGAFQSGVAQGQQQREATARQAQLDEERRQQQAVENQRAASAEQRAAQDQRMQQLSNALGVMDRFGIQQAETATDPVAAENAMLGRAAGLESAFELPQGQLSGFIPNMGPAISTRKKKLAEETYGKAEKLYGAEAMAGDSITIHTEAFGPVKPSQLRALFAPQATVDGGAPVPVMTAKPDAPNTPEEKLADAIRRGDQGEIDVLTKAAETISGARRDPAMADLNRQIAQARLENMQRPGAAGLAPATQRRVDVQIRAFDAQPVVKRIQTMAEAVQFAEGLNPQTPNPQDDQALIYAYAKAMDPDSVVREGEYATVQRYAQTWAERFGFQAVRIFSNQPFLTAEARANMKATIRARFEAARPQYDNLRRSYATRIGRITGQPDGDTYLIDYAAGFPEKPQQATPGGLRQPVSNPFRPRDATSR